MKPVAIIRFTSSDGPAYFATYLEKQAIPAQVIALDEGAKVPRDAGAFSGIAIMGGPMSVNDALPWIAPVLKLIRDAVAKDVPLIGHCLGGQLMSKAFGGSVGPSPAKEIGWGAVEVQDNAVARDWFGELPAFESFHWHGETFTIPPGATRVLSSRHCENQGFAVGKHLGLQCHVEMTVEAIETWCGEGGEEIHDAADSPGVQQPAEIARDLGERVERLNAVAEALYGRWALGLSKA